MTKHVMMFARNICIIEDHGALIDDANDIAADREQAKQGDVFIARQVFPESLLEQIKEYLVGIGKNSLPNYKPIEMGCPNFHRINYWDERAYVKGCFHQFVFFPWNQDIFGLFELTRDVYYMKNLLSNNRKDRFMQRGPEDGCVRRLSFQFYPKGMGGMNKHRDPVDHHQLTACSLILSKKGREFMRGGLYVEKEEGEKLYLDDITDIGDMVYINAQTPHGVERIDADATPDWLSFEGRWTLLIAINKIGDDNVIADSVDLAT